MRSLRKKSAKQFVKSLTVLRFISEKVTESPKTLFFNLYIDKELYTAMIKRMKIKVNYFNNALFIVIIAKPY